MAMIKWLTIFKIEQKAVKHFADGLRPWQRNLRPMYWSYLQQRSLGMQGQGQVNALGLSVFYKKPDPLCDIQQFALGNRCPIWYKFVPYSL